MLSDTLPVSPRCTHIKGNGGAKAAVRQVLAHLPANSFVLRTDVKSYYASIGHVALMDRLAQYITDRSILNLLGHYTRRTSERGGEFWDYERGISSGCPLSPLMGAFFLNELDERMERTGLFYVRFMDDILVLAPSRWTLRRAVKAANEVLESLRLEKHPDKTFPLGQDWRQDREGVRLSWLSFQPGWTCVGLVESCLFTPGLPSRTGPGSGSRASSAAGSDCRTRRCIWPPRSRLGRGSARRPARSVRT